MPKRVDHRTRHDQIIRREHAFDLQMDALVEVYMNRSVKQKDCNRLGSGRGFCVGMENVPAVAELIHVKIVDVFGKCKFAKMFHLTLCYSYSGCHPTHDHSTHGCIYCIGSRETGSYSLFACFPMSGHHD